MDVKEFLEPVSEETPSGVDLRLVPDDETFREIRDLRKTAVVDLSSDTEWNRIASICESAFERTRDLELAARWTEARLRQLGFSALRDGLCLLRELVANFWSTVHPGAGADVGEIDLDIRRGRLEWLASGKEFLLSVKRIPIVYTRGTEPRGWQDYLFADKVDHAKMAVDQTAYNELKESGYIGSEEWLEGLGSTPPERLRELADAVTSCVDEVRALTAACDEKFGSESPSLMALDDVLCEINEYLQSKIQGPGGSDETTGATGAAGSGDTGQFGGASSGGAITTRAEALKRLQEVADYYRATEPHSPVSYLVQRAIRWGRLPFEDLVRDFIKDSSTIDQIMETLGIGKQAGE